MGLGPIFFCQIIFFFLLFYVVIWYNGIDENEVISMFLKKDLRPNGKTFLAVIKGFRDPVTKKVKNKTMLKVGYLEDLLDQYPDPIAHFEEVARKMTEEENRLAMPLSFSFDRNEEIDSSGGLRKNLGFSILSHYYHNLEINKFLINRQKSLGIEYSLNNIMQFLVYQRIIDPCSKYRTYEGLESSFFEDDSSLPDVYRALGYFSDYRNDILRHIDESVKVRYGRDLTHSYYDVTNFWFEINQEDDFKKRGFCKSNKKKPIIQMGMLLDNNGIPMTFRLFEGNVHDSETYLPVLSEIKEEFNIQRTIVVADKGMNTGENMAYNIIKGDGFIFSQSVRGANQETKDFVLDEKGYKFTGDEGFRMKSRIVPAWIWITDYRGKKKKVQIDQKQVAFYSPDYDRRAKHDREKVIQKTEGLLAQNKHVRTTGAYKYIAKEETDLETGEVIKTRDEYILDLERIREEEKYDGYYLIVTSELKMNDTKIIEAYRGLWRIEESFRITKTEFKARPVYLSDRKHIEGHFVTCFVALLLLRLLERDVALENRHYTVKELIESMRNYTGTYLGENYYMFDFTSPVIETFGKIMNQDLTKRFRNRSEIKNIIAATKKTV